MIMMSSRMGKVGNILSLIRFLYVARPIASPILAYVSICLLELLRMSSLNSIVPGSKMTIVDEPPKAKYLFVTFLDDLISVIGLLNGADASSANFHHKHLAHRRCFYLCDGALVLPEVAKVA